MQSNFGDYRAFLFPFVLSHLLLFCLTYFETLRAEVSQVLSSPPSGSSEQSPAAKHVKCVLLCIIMFNGCAKIVII